LKEVPRLRVELDFDDVDARGLPRKEGKKKGKFKEEGRPDEV